MDSKDILKDADATPRKKGLKQHFRAIDLLRHKGYSWRDIADFLNKRGVVTDHTKVYRQYKKEKNMNTITIPTVADYTTALQNIEITDKQRKMLEAHYNANKVTVSYTELAIAAGYEDNSAANLQYGKFAHALGDAMSFEFSESKLRAGEPFYGSVIGYENESSGDEFQLVMYPELIKAICALAWF